MRTVRGCMRAPCRGKGAEKARTRPDRHALEIGLHASIPDMSRLRGGRFGPVASRRRRGTRHGRLPEHEHLIGRYVYFPVEHGAG